MGSEGDRIVVIGSGPAGAAAALALVERGLPVTLLESGERMPADLLVRAGGRTVFRRRQTRPEHPPPVVGAPGSDWVTAHEPGGLSNHWSGAVPRFCPEDFTEGEQLHERYRWPVAYAAVEPFYERVERLLRLAGQPEAACGLPAQQITYPTRLPRDWRPAQAVAARFGQGLAPTPLAGAAPWSLARSATTFSSLAIVRRLLRRPNFDLRLGAHALRLRWDGVARRVTAVEYRERRTGATARLGARAVVVGAGALSSTKLLFDSACADFPEGLGNTEGLLGLYLHDHYKDLFTLDLDRPMSRLGHTALLTRSPYGESPPLAGVQLTLGGRTSQLDRALTFTPLPATRFGVIAFGSVIPQPSNCARPDPDQKDEFGLPRLRLHLAFTPEEKRHAARARDRLVQVLEGAGIRARATAMAEERIGAAIHYGGTVRMHADRRHGMADGWARLHAVPNVAVVDASGFTTAVEKNPVLTVMALSMRAAERLAEDCRAL